jgi:hypothetical protein
MANMDEVDERAAFLEQAIAQQKESLLRVMEQKLQAARSHLEQSSQVLARLQVREGIFLSSASEQAREVAGLLQDPLLKELPGSASVRQAAENASSALSFAYMATDRLSRDAQHERRERSARYEAEQQVHLLRAAHSNLLMHAQVALRNEEGIVDNWKRTGGELQAGLLMQDNRVFAELEGLMHLQKLLEEHLFDIAATQPEI